MDAPATVVLAVAYASVSYVELRIEKRIWSIYKRAGHPLFHWLRLKWTPSYRW